MVVPDRSGPPARRSLRERARAPRGAMENALRRVLELAALTYCLLLQPSEEVAADRVRLNVRPASVGVLKKMVMPYPAVSVSGHEPGKLLPTRPCKLMLTPRRSCA
jgi:hypothetical protein